MKRGLSGICALCAVDKPLGCTSHDVVGRVRRALGERRVGHAGTLDPDASGVLVVGIGQATRLMGMLTLDRKGYRATIEFGSETDTDDAEGAVTKTADVPARLSEQGVAEAVVASLVGSQMQVPPRYSAISVDGRRSYARARSGEDFELEARQVEVFSAELVSLSSEPGEPLRWVVDLVVSSGCYVRAIARDLGRSLGSAAHLVGLVRSSAGPIGLSDCVSLDELEELGVEGMRKRWLDPVEALGIERVELDERMLESVRVGRQLRLPPSLSSADEGTPFALVRAGRLYGVWTLSKGRLVSQATFPEGIEGVRA